MRISEEIERLQSILNAYGDLRIMKTTNKGSDRHLDRVEECMGIGVNRVIEVQSDDYVVFNEEDEEDEDLVIELEDIFDDDVGNILSEAEKVVIPSGEYGR